MSDRILSQSCPEDALEDINAILNMASFTSPPKVGLRLLELCGSPTAGAVDIARTLETDPTLAAKLIRLANTVHYGAGIPVTNIQAATVRLGTDKIKSVALAFEIVGIAGGFTGDHFDFESYWQGCLARGCIARAIAMNCNRPIAGEAFLVGLLQDIAIPILTEHAPKAHAAMLQRSGGCQLRLAMLETQLFGFNHLHVVTLLFERWKMPALLADAVGRHHARPPMHSAADPALRLWQIAYFVGALPIGDRRKPTFYDASLGDMPAKTFGLTASVEAGLFRQAEQEFHDVEEMFRPYMGRGVRAADLMAQAAEVLAATVSSAEAGGGHRSGSVCGAGLPAGHADRSHEIPVAATVCDVVEGP